MKKLSDIISKKQAALSITAVVCAVVAFALFFVDAVTDAGGDGLEAYKIAFRASMGKMYFNAAAFIAFLLPLIGLVLTVIPCRKTKFYLLPAVLFAAAGVMMEMMFQIYQIPFNDEIRRLHVAAGERIAPAAIVAGWMSIGAAVCCGIKAFSPLKDISNTEAVCVPCDIDAGQDTAGEAVPIADGEKAD